MPNQFFSAAEGDLENYFVTDYWVIDQYFGDRLWVWGNNLSSQLGEGTSTNKQTPITTFAGGTNWKQISIDSFSTAAIKTDGTLWTWGRGSYGRLGNATTGNISTPITTFAGGNNWKQVDVAVSKTNSGFMSAIKVDGTLWAWGSNEIFQLGNISTVSVSTPITILAGGTNWKQVSCGGGHVAATKTDGTLWTWGSGSSGQLGKGGFTYGFVSTPVTTFAGGTNWADTATGAPEELDTMVQGWQFSAAIKTDGTLWTWGNNSASGFFLGNGSSLPSPTPITTFAGGTNWKQISISNNGAATGISFIGAVKTDGTLWVWGNNVNGQLGNGLTNVSISTPITTFAGGTNWKQVSCSARSMLATKTDGTLWAWGNSIDGNLGNGIGTSNTISTPVTTFAGGTNWGQISCSSAYYVSAIKTDGTLWTWGNGGSVGYLGRISAGTNAFTPITTFSGGTNWADTATGAPEELYTISAGGRAGSSVSLSAAVKTDGTLWVWGSASQGSLGNGITLSSTFVPTPITTFAGGTNWKTVDLNMLSNVSGVGAIKTDGTLWMWGGDFYGTLGNGGAAADASTPVTTFAGGTNWRQVSRSRTNTAAIKTDGTLWLWGLGAFGRHGAAGNQSDMSTPITTFAGGTNWRQVSCQEGAKAAVKTDGTLWTWGTTSYGKLGSAATVGSGISTPVTTFAGGTNWLQVSMGAQHCAAVKTDGTLWIWGRAFQEGRLGNGVTLANTSTPITTFAGGTNWKQVSCGGDFTAAIKTDGTLWAWGSNAYGKLGNNSTVSVSTPVTTFVGGTNWVQVRAGDTHMIALSNTAGSRQLWVWGNNNTGQLGRLIISDAFVPNTTFAGGTDWKQVSSGVLHTAAIKTDGTLWGWGQSIRLGTGTTGIISTPVTTFAGGTNWKQVSAGYAHTVAVKTDGTLWTWGSGASGGLGNASTIVTSTPVTTFAGGTNWKQVNAGRSTSFALNVNGSNKELYVFGNNLISQLGLNLHFDLKVTPSTTFAGGTNWKQVACGYSHTAAIKTDGTLWIWGNGGNRQLGTNDTVNRQTPVTTFAGGTNWRQVSCGENHTAAIKTDGTLWTWGLATSGRLGNNDTVSPFSTPTTTFAGGTDWKQVSCGDLHTAAVKLDGTLWVWGNAFEGATGTNSTINRLTPSTTFLGGNNWKQVSAGNDNTAAVTSAVVANVPELPLS